MLLVLFISSLLTIFWVVFGAFLFTERKHQKVVNTLKRSPSRRCSVSKDIRSPTYNFGKSKLLKSPGDNSFIRIEEVDPTDINVKIEEVPLTIPKINHNSKGKLAKAHGKNMIPSKGKSVAERQAGNLKIAQKKQVVNKGRRYTVYSYKIVFFPYQFFMPNLVSSFWRFPALCAMIGTGIAPCFTPLFVPYHCSFLLHI